MSGSAEEVKKHIGVYLKVAGALAVGTVVTVLAAYLDVAVALGIVIALIIATTKGSLVVAYFMHLLEERSKSGCQRREAQWQFGGVDMFGNEQRHRRYPQVEQLV